MDNNDKTTTVVPAGMEVVLPKENKLTVDQARKFAMNALIFTAPVFAIFFGQLAAGVSWKVAIPVALLGFYGLAADYFKKLKDTTPYLREK